MSGETGKQLDHLDDEAARLVEENRRLKDELDARNAAIQALADLNNLAHRISRGTDSLRLLNEILRLSMTAVRASEGSLLLINPQTGGLVFTATSGGMADRLRHYEVPPGEGIAGWVAAHRQPQLVPEVRSDPRFFPRVDEELGFETRSLLAVPLIDGDRVLGVLEAVNKTTDRAFNESDLETMLVVAELASAALMRGRKQ